MTGSTVFNAITLVAASACFLLLWKDFLMAVRNRKPFLAMVCLCSVLLCLLLIFEMLWRFSNE